MRTVDQFFYASFLMLSLSLSVMAQREKSTLLPLTEAKDVTKQCSRPSPSNFSDTWVPSKIELQEMEARLADIKKMRVKECCIVGEQIENPEGYYMQYMGIIVAGKKLIYINAFAASEPYEGWKEKAVIICDGGTAWGVLYDPKTRKFHNLAVNGVG